jgi:cyclopropane-fatty-acyl-phospholipid synthase
MKGSLDVECLRPHCVKALWHWADALEDHLDETTKCWAGEASRRFAPIACT